MPASQQRDCTPNLNVHIENDEKILYSAHPSLTVLLPLYYGFIAHISAETDALTQGPRLSESIYIFFLQFLGDL